MKTFLLPLVAACISLAGLSDLSAQLKGSPHATNRLLQQMSQSITQLQAEVAALKKEIGIVDSEVHALEAQLARGGGRGPGRGPVYGGSTGVSDWTATEPLRVFGGVRTAGVHEARIPRQVPGGASAILVHAYWENGKTPENRQFTIETETREGGKKYPGLLTVHTYPNSNSVSYSSTSFWLPVTGDRRVFVRMPYTITGGSFQAWVTGWQGGGGGPAFSGNVRWNALEPIRVFSGLRRKGLVEANLPPQIPPTASEILVHVYFENGKTSQNQLFSIETGTREGNQTFPGLLTVHTYPNTNSLSYSSSNFWLPVTSNRRIYAHMPVSIDNGNYQAWVAGWR